MSRGSPGHRSTNGSLIAAQLYTARWGWGWYCAMGMGMVLRDGDGVEDGIGARIGPAIRAHAE